MEALQLIREKNHVVVQIDNGKVNAVDTKLVKELEAVFLELEKDESVKGVILTGRPNCFSAGLNIKHMAELGIEGAYDFWRTYMGALRAMVKFSKPLVAALTGYAPAAATIFALCADYRIMAQGPKHTMGMNEFNMSLQIPQMLCDVFAYYMGEQRAWEAVQVAQMYNSDECVAIGLANESLPVEEVLPAAEVKLKKLMKVYLPVYGRTKKWIRKGLIEIVDQDIEKLAEEFVETLKDPFVAQMLAMFIQSLKQK